MTKKEAMVYVKKCTAKILEFELDNGSEWLEGYDREFTPTQKKKVCAAVQTLIAKLAEEPKTRAKHEHVGSEEV